MEIICIFDNSDADISGVIDHKYVVPAKTFTSILKDSHCTDIGFTVAAGSKVINVTHVDDLTVSWFKQDSRVEGDTCSFHDCWDADIGCKLQIDRRHVAPAKVFKTTQKASHFENTGFIVSVRTKAINVTDAGDMTISCQDPGRHPPAVLDQTQADPDDPEGREELAGSTDNDH